MTEIEKKALALVNEVAAERGTEYPCVDRRNDARWEALCRAIEQHEAYKQEVSDAVADVANTSDLSIPSWYMIRSHLERFIIPKPAEPMNARLREAMEATGMYYDDMHMKILLANLAKRGLKIVEDV